MNNCCVLGRSINIDISNMIPHFYRPWLHVHNVVQPLLSPFPYKSQGHCLGGQARPLAWPRPWACYGALGLQGSQITCYGLVGRLFILKPLTLAATCTLGISAPHLGLRDFASKVKLLKYPRANYFISWYLTPI